MAWPMSARTKSLTASTAMSTRAVSSLSCSGEKWPRTKSICAPRAKSLPMPKRRRDADGAEGQGEVVHQDEDVGRLDVLLVFPVAHGVAAEVHICRGFEQCHQLVLEAEAGDVAVAFGGPGGAYRLGQGVGDAEADVVPGAGIFRADVAQSDNKIFVAHRGDVCFKV